MIFDQAKIFSWNRHSTTWMTPTPPSRHLAPTPRAPTPAQPHLMLAEVERARELIQRPTIRQELAQERDTLLVKLLERISFQAPPRVA